MSKIFLSSLLIAGLQLFNTTYGQFNFGADTVDLVLIDGKLNDSYITISNSAGSEDLEYRWTELNRVINTSWEAQLCDCVTCYSDYHSLPEGISVDCVDFLAIPAKTDFTEFKFSINPNGVTDEGFLTLQFEELGGDSSTATLTFKAYNAPSSTGQLSNLNAVESHLNNDFLIIENTLGKSNLEVRIVDVTGKLISNDNMSSNLHLVNVSSLASGTYIVNVVSGNSILHTRKFSK